MSGPLQDEQLQVLPAQSVPQTLLAATAPDAKRRARPKTNPGDDIPSKRNRALKAHLTETELELAKTRVNSKNETIHAVVDAEYVRIGASGENISPKWWEKTLEAFNFGQGVENQLKDDGDPNQPVDPDLVNAIKECYHSNPAKRKCNMFKNYLLQVEAIPRKDLRYMWSKSVEQKGLPRHISDGMLQASADYLGRTAMPYSRGMCNRLGIGPLEPFGDSLGGGACRRLGIGRLRALEGVFGVTGFLGSGGGGGGRRRGNIPNHVHMGTFPKPPATLAMPCYTML